MSLDQSPWDISEGNFPRTGTNAAKLRFLLGYATLAPSSHNSQPWKFRIEEDAVEIFADRTRALPVVDPDDRELSISCGAALYCLQLAARHFGWDPEIILQPDHRSPDLLARLELKGSKYPSPAEDSLFHSITKRRTTRLAYDRRIPPVALLDSIEATASGYRVWPRIIEDDTEKRAIAKLIAKADRMQMAAKSFRRELAAWIHPARSASGDGMPGYAFGMPSVLDFASTGFAAVVRTFDMGDGMAAKDERLALSSPVLLTLGTEDDTPTAWLRTGMALAEILLLACAEGVTASYLNQPCEIAELRSAVADALGYSGLPQLILRMGYSTEVPPTPRRRVDDVLVS